MKRRERYNELLERAQGVVDCINEMIGELEAEEALIEYRRGQLTMSVSPIVERETTAKAEKNKG